MKLLIVILTFAYGIHGWSSGDFKDADAKWVSQSTICVIFTILVSFLWDNALFASKAKINVF